LNQNPIFEDNVNVSKTHPLTDLLWLTGGAVLIVVSLTILLYVSMQWLASYIPFSYEEKLISNVNFSLTTEPDNELSKGDKQRLVYIQGLTDRLAKAQDLDKDITITVHWMDDDMVNAFATLGGHIFITKGLWDAMPNENTLAMVIGHEIAHANHRDPLKNLGAGVTLSLISSLVFGSGDASMSLINSTGLITSFHFGREMESEADAAGIQTLFNHYGHVAGSTEFFEGILDKSESDLAFLQTHPVTQDRIDKLHAIQQKNGWPNKQDLTIKLPK
jgi:predicted Zn-dependent protease